jgi:hypothetical protein
MRRGLRFSASTETLPAFASITLNCFGIEVKEYLKVYARGHLGEWKDYVLEKHEDCS